MMTTSKFVTVWKVWLRNQDGETDTIEITNATDQFDAKSIAVERYNRLGWYAVESTLILSGKL